MRILLRGAVRALSLRKGGCYKGIKKYWSTKNKTIILPAINLISWRSQAKERQSRKHNRNNCLPLISPQVTFYSHQPHTHKIVEIHHIFSLNFSKCSSCWNFFSCFLCLFKEPFKFLLLIFHAKYFNHRRFSSWRNKHTFFVAFFVWKMIADETVKCFFPFSFSSFALPQSFGSFVIRNSLSRNILWENRYLSNFMIFASGYRVLAVEWKSTRRIGKQKEHFHLQQTYTKDRRKKSLTYFTPTSAEPDLFIIKM